MAIGLAAWTFVPPIATLTQAAPGPLIAELARLDAQLGRVEVVPLRTHGEASMVAPHVYLVRGWNRQTDVERNPLFYDGTLTAASYRTWLTDWSVGHVVLPAKDPDSSGIAEAGLLTAGQTWLPLVWGDTSWRIYRRHRPGAHRLVTLAAGTDTIATRSTFDRGTPCRPADQAIPVQIRAPRPATTQ